MYRCKSVSRVHNALTSDMKTYLLVYNTYRATSFIITSNWKKNPQYPPTDEQIKCSISIIDYSGIEKYELQTHTTEMNLKNMPFGPRWSTRDQIYVPDWNNTGQNIWNTGFQTLDKWLCPGGIRGLWLPKKEKQRWALWLPQLTGWRVSGPKGEM